MSRRKIKRKNTVITFTDKFYQDFGLQKPSNGKLATEEDLERLSNDPNFVAAVKEVERAMAEDEATTITVTLAPGMYERIERHLMDTFAECESVETFITDALDDVLNGFIDDPLMEGS